MESALDAHVHLWTDRRDLYPRVAGAVEYSPASFTPEDFIRHARPNGVTRAVLVQMSFYGFDNSYMLDSMREHPGAFSGIAVVDSHASDPASTMQSLAGQGVRGFRVVAGQSERWLESPGMAAMWRCGSERRLAMCLLINPENLTSVGKMCERFPDTSVVIDHLARIGVDGNVRDSDIRLLCGLARHRNVYVKVSAFYALGLKRSPYRDLSPLIRRVFEDFGPRHLMWASDCPFQVEDGHTYSDSLTLIRDGLPFLSPEDRSWMLAKTAESLFFTA